jgi:hypothetical protein
MTECGDLDENKRQVIQDDHIAFVASMSPCWQGGYMSGTMISSFGVDCLFGAPCTAFLRAGYGVFPAGGLTVRVGIWIFEACL